MAIKKGQRLYRRCRKCSEYILDDHWWQQGKEGREHADCQNPTMTITDGFGLTVSVVCPKCGGRMRFVGIGDARCENEDSGKCK